mmetsp:Transcript_7991/g.16102  ORF Transcript_7991/g.16102 Transcript_7991/m.16102 type:complete len:260 (-) Transcript_7991:903-1682(-)
MLTKHSHPHYSGLVQHAPNELDPTLHVLQAVTRLGCALPHQVVEHEVVLKIAYVEFMIGPLELTVPEPVHGLVNLPHKHVHLPNVHRPQLRRSRLVVQMKLYKRPLNRSCEDPILFHEYPSLDVLLALPRPQIHLVLKQCAGHAAAPRVPPDGNPAVHSLGMPDPLIDLVDVPRLLERAIEVLWTPGVVLNLLLGPMVLIRVAQTDKSSLNGRDNISIVPCVTVLDGALNYSVAPDSLRKGRMDVAELAQNSAPLGNEL